MCHLLQLAAKEGMWPDLISTDLHTGCTEGPAYDLVTVMTKVCIRWIVQSWPIKFQKITQRPDIECLKAGVRSTTVSTQVAVCACSAVVYT